MIEYTLCPKLMEYIMTSRIDDGSSIGVLVTGSPPSTNNSAWQGRTVQTFRDIGNGLQIGAKKVAEGFASVFKDANAFGRLLRLGINTFSAIEMVIGKPGAFSRASERFLNTESVIDSLQAIDSVGYFVSRKDREDSISNVLSNAAFLAAGVGTIVLFLGEVTLINLSKIGESLGRLPVFGMMKVAGFSLGNLVTGAIGIGFLFAGADAIHRVIHSDNRFDRTKAWLDLAWSIAEVAKCTLMLVGLTNPVVLLTFGSVAAGLGITAFLYGISVEEQKKSTRAVA